MCSLCWCIRVRSLFAPGVETCFQRSLVMLPASACSCDYSSAPLRRPHECRFDDGSLFIAICLTSPRSALRLVQAFHMTPSPAARAGSRTFLALSTLCVNVGASALPNAHQKGNTHRDACQLVSGQYEGAVFSQQLSHSITPRAAVGVRPKYLGVRMLQHAGAAQARASSSRASRMSQQSQAHVLACVLPFGATSCVEAMMTTMPEITTAAAGLVRGIDEALTQPPGVLPCSDMSRCPVPDSLPLKQTELPGSKVF